MATLMNKRMRDDGFMTYYGISIKNAYSFTHMYT